MEKVKKNICNLHNICFLSFFLEYFICLQFASNQLLNFSQLLYAVIFDILTLNLRDGKPGVYTEVKYFIDWIQETIEQE